MSNGRIKSVTYSNMLLLTIDVENALKKVDLTIEKFFFHFLRYNVECSYAKPYFIKFTTVDKETGEKEEHKWTMREMCEYLRFVPLYKMCNRIETEYNAVDINDKLFPLRDENSTAKLKEMERESYEYELKHGNVIVSVEILKKIEEMLEYYGIGYKIQYIRMGEGGNESEVEGERDGVSESEGDSDMQYPSHMIVYDEYEGVKPSYNVVISLDNRLHVDKGFCISPEPVEYSQFMAVGVFKYFDNAYVEIASEEHIAVLTSCDECEAPMICDWMSLKGTRCPYCDMMKVI